MDRLMDCLPEVSVFLIIGSVSMLMVLGAVGSMLAACWKVARRVWKWASKRSESGQGRRAVDEPEPVDARPLHRASPNWQKASTKLADRTPTLDIPIYYC
jgi:hypothetical protein